MRRRDGIHGRRILPRRGFALALIVTLLVGCTANHAPEPGPNTDSAAGAAAQLAAGLAKKDLTPIDFVAAASASVNALFQPLVSGMGPLAPTVSVGTVNSHGDRATATLAYTWRFPGVPQPWTYSAQAALAKEAGRWKTQWQPSILHPQLDGSNRLSQRRRYPARGQIRGEDGVAIVTRRAVVRVGLDKSRVSPAKAPASAVRLAKLVGIDPQAYAKQVAAAGNQAFVEAIVFRSGAKERPPDARVYAIPGALPLQDEEMLGPSRDFARPVLGTVGEATKEAVDASGGAVVAGDQVGLSGLQKRYDPQLRGTPGVQVRLVAAKPSASTPSASASPTPASSPSPSVAAPVQLFEVPAVAGTPLTTTINPGLQQLAEKTLSKTKPASALVAIRPSTGAVVAVASGPGSREQSTATLGQVPPGSTFKVASSLALLRAGLTPRSPVTCPATLKVSGRTFTNYSDYPSGDHGTIDLQTALAQSCNTAFIGQRNRLGGQALAQAAGSLGLGVDYDVGSASYFGSVPSGATGTDRAAEMIGQDKVQASPLAMAAVMASVAAGKTVVPHLIENIRATPKATPLSPAEAAQLQAMMRAVVTEGSGRGLADLPGPSVLAKTGTAEYGTKAPYRTHAWMIAAQGDLAVAVFVADGPSGSRTAGPLLHTFLAGSR